MHCQVVHCQVFIAPARFDGQARIDVGHYAYAVGDGLPVAKWGGGSATSPQSTILQEWIVLLVVAKI